MNRRRERTIGQGENNGRISRRAAVSLERPCTRAHTRALTQRGQDQRVRLRPIRFPLQARRTFVPCNGYIRQGI